MANNIVRLEGDACYEITLRNASLPYKESSKLAGQTYSRFSYDGVIFNVNDSLGFAQALEKQDLASVKLVETSWEKTVADDDGNESKAITRGFEFDSFTKESDAFTRQTRRAAQKGKLAAIEKMSSSEDVSPEMLKVLLGVSFS